MANPVIYKGANLMYVSFPTLTSKNTNLTIHRLSDGRIIQGYSLEGYITDFQPAVMLPKNYDGSAAAQSCDYFTAFDAQRNINRSWAFNSESGVLWYARDENAEI